MFFAMVRGLLGGEQDVAVATAATTAAEASTARRALGRAETAERNDTAGPLSRLRGELSGSGKSGPAGHHHVLATRLHPKDASMAPELRKIAPPVISRPGDWVPRSRPRGYVAPRPGTGFGERVMGSTLSVERALA
jgi:hypothetical protein